MRISEIKSALKELESLDFRLPNGDLVPAHFHLTEIGKISKHFIDCGGTMRKEEIASFQLWNANDVDHRLSPAKLLDIIELSEEKLQLGDPEIEVEYQGQTIEKYGLELNGQMFSLTPLQTDCLAKDNCRVPEKKPRIRLSELQNSSCCTPESGCC